MPAAGRSRSGSMSGGRAAHVGLHYRGMHAFTDALTLVDALAPLRDELTARRSPLELESRWSRSDLR